MMVDEITRLLRALPAQGFAAKRTKKSHWLIYNRDGRVVATLAGTGSDMRGLHNAIAKLRRAGLIWPPPPRR
jgi:predicted RNA binding protein YcfA (HicA-like mRNA interferase family)